MNHSDIVNKIPERFNNALKAGDLLFFPSTTTKHLESIIEYEIRLCPALQHKPTASTLLAIHSNRGKSFDPFAPYNTNLYVGEIKDDESQDEFIILMNKYSVVPHHFLMVTKEFKPQSSPLVPSELLHAYLLLVSERKAGNIFFSFYNCGENSGASQPHKHIQFVPLDNENGPPIERLARQAQLEFADRPFSLSELSYASHTFRFPPDIGSLSMDRLEAILSSAFIQLLDLSISTIRHDPDYPTGSPSYNVILTLEHLHLIPRKHETYTLRGTDDEISINSMGFAGMLLVRSEDELEAVKREGVANILRGVALESVHDLQSDRGNAKPQLNKGHASVPIASHHPLSDAIARSVHVMGLARLANLRNHEVIVFGGASPILEARRVISSSEAASLQGKPALTPIIAGSICGGLLFISWTVGFIVYFRKRANRKKRKRLIAEGKAQPREKDLKPLQEKVVIPPDPAVLLGQRKGGEMVFPERENSNPGRMRWSRRAIPASSSKGTSTSGTSEDISGTFHMDTKQRSSDGPVNDASPRPKLGIQTNDTAVVASSRSEAIDLSETTADDQVADVMTVPAEV